MMTSKPSPNYLRYLEGGETITMLRNFVGFLAELGYVLPPSAPAPMELAEMFLCIDSARISEELRLVAVE